jgi:hypothetical protein
MNFFLLETSKSYHTTKNKKKQQQQHVAQSQDNCISEANEITSDKKHSQDIKSHDHFHENNENNKNNSNNFADNMMAKGNESGSDGSQIQCIRFSPFQQHQWHTLLDHNHQEL